MANDAVPKEVDELGLVELASGSVEVQQIRSGQQQNEEVRLANETSVRILANDLPVARIRCTPFAIEKLARGFMLTEGFVVHPEQIKSVWVDSDGEKAHAQLDVPTDELQNAIEGLAIGSGCGGGVSRDGLAFSLDCEKRFDLSITVDANEVIQLAKTFQKLPELYWATHGVHAAAMVKDNAIVAFAEDIGRHNAVDKVVGALCERGDTFSDKGLLTTGRVTLDIAAKAARLRAAYIISRAAPSVEAVQLAQSFHVAVLSVRGQRLNVYSAPFRVRPVTEGAGSG